MTGLTLSFAPERADAHNVEVVVRAGDAERRVSFSANVPLAENGDALVALGLLPAIELAVPLAVEATVSAQLLARLPDIQALLCSWHKGCAPVAVSTQGAVQRRNADRMSGVFFSGGADSFYSLLENRSRADALITLIGADIAPHNAQGRQRLEGLARRVAEELGIEPVIVTTDLRAVSDPMIGWDDYHGSALAAAGHLLSGSISTGIIAASADEIAWRYPWGSSPLLDPMWSSEQVAFEHHGCVPRTEKFARLADSDLAMANLRVCYLTGDAGNCGACAKCTYARLALDVLGARVGPFPDVPLRMATLRVTDMASESKHRALARLAREHGRETIARAVERAILAYHRRAVLYRAVPLPALKRRFKQRKRRARLAAGRLFR